MRRRWILISLFLLLLIGGGALCAIRWQAWFGNPAEPQWTADTLDYHFYTFAADSLPGFVQTKDGWQDTQSPDTLRILLLGDVHNSLLRADYDTLAARNPHLDCYAQLATWRLPRTRLFLLFPATLPRTVGVGIRLAARSFLSWQP